MPESRRALFITYTLENPIAAGVFFRAVRLASELTNRGWTCVILNFGPRLNDPKVDAMAGNIMLRYDVETTDVWKALRQFRDIDPGIIIFGEAPFARSMELLWAAAAMSGKPFILLEQYYDLSTPGAFDVDLMLLYGLKCFWPKGTDSHQRWVIVPPFINSITPAANLPVPSPAPSAQRVLILGSEPVVLAEGIRLIAALEQDALQVVAISSNPENAARQMAEAGIPSTNAVALPLQRDADLFGLLQSSAASIMGNGFMQMSEALALECPAVLVDRGIGMWPGQVSEVFQPYVSFACDRKEHLQALRRWLEQSPFDERLRKQLKQERNGAAECAAYVDRVVSSPHHWRIKRRQISWRARHVCSEIGSRLHTREATA
jgi:hypothetical protein